VEAGQSREARSDLSFDGGLDLTLKRVHQHSWAVFNGCYALIAASSGWIPMMFMARVRL
jgi:hypothetical protein